MLLLYPHLPYATYPTLTLAGKPPSDITMLGYPAPTIPLPVPHGTPYHLSPEICEGKAYNHKSDIWSLGVVMNPHSEDSAHVGAIGLALEPLVR